MSIIIRNSAGNTFTDCRVISGQPNVLYFRCTGCNAQQCLQADESASISMQGECPFCRKTTRMDIAIKSSDEPAPSWFDPSAVRALP